MGAETRKGPAGKRRWRLAVAAVLGLAALGGCNPLMMFAFMFPADNKAPPACSLALDGKESRVAILAYFAGGGPSDPALSGADFSLTTRLYQLLTERFKENKDRVTIVPPNQVRNYQNSNPRWRDKSPQKIGEKFAADFVVTLEIQDLRLSDGTPGTHRFLYQGHAEISVTVTDVHKDNGE